MIQQPPPPDLTWTSLTHYSTAGASRSDPGAVTTWSDTLSRLLYSTPSGNEPEEIKDENKNIRPASSKEY